MNLTFEASSPLEKLEIAAVKFHDMVEYVTTQVLGRLIGHHGHRGPGRAALLGGLVPRQPGAGAGDGDADALRERAHGRRYLHSPQEPGMRNSI